MVNPGDIVKVKCYGMKRKFKVLGPLDIITSGCVQCLVLTDNPLCYTKTLSKFRPDLDWRYSKSIGEYVCDWHTTRIYLEPII